MRDFTLTQLLVFEELTSPAMQLVIDGFSFWLPTIWNILIVDSETSQLDVVEISALAGSEFEAFTYGPDESKVEPKLVTVTDYKSRMTIVGPSLNKHQMMCHPISPTSWINISPSDTYTKYLKDCVLGDLM